MSFFGKLFKSNNVIKSSKDLEEAELDKGELIEDNRELNNDYIPEAVISYYIDNCTKEELKNELNNELDNFVFYNQFFYESIDVDLYNIDTLFEDAARLLLTHQIGSTSLIQRKFSIGYNRAGRLMDQLEFAGIVSPAEGSNPRHVLITDEQSLKIKLKLLPTLDNNKKSELRIEYAELIDAKKAELKNRFYFEKKQYEENAVLQEKEQIRLELLEKERKRNLRKQVKKELLESRAIEAERKRGTIPQDIQDKVWVRDGGKCVICGSSENLEFDHIIPFSKGGSDTYRNIQLLCESCNRKKSNNIGN